ncbi:hypothetical protein TruAng_001195 [Truncatella angustata]|nr:hypothetical protein TruAng_001195 [Truncatella angustata]
MAGDIQVSKEGIQIIKGDFLVIKDFRASTAVIQDNKENIPDLMKTRADRQEDITGTDTHPASLPLRLGIRLVRHGKEPATVQYNKDFKVKIVLGHPMEAPATTFLRHSLRLHKGSTTTASHGRRKALLIGINYIGQKNELRGCINDVKNLSAFLIERYNYKYEDMVILTDDQSDAVRHPTKANIIRAMGWLVQGAQPGDSLFLHYSGHGGQTEDLDGDEDDGFDEVIYPVDFQTAGHIVDDNIHDMCVKPLLPGVRLTAIFDSCHSGTAMDLPYVYSTKGVLKEPNLAAEAGQGALAAFSAYASGDIGGVISSVMGFAKKAMNGDDAYNKTMATKTSPADVIMFSGSKDDQTSADAMIASEATGAMSWAFVTALKQNPQQTYVQLLNSIREVLETKYTQKPQLSCSHPLGLYSHILITI